MTGTKAAFTDELISAVVVWVFLIFTVLKEPNLLRIGVSAAKISSVPVAYITLVCFRRAIVIIALARVWFVRAFTMSNQSTRLFNCHVDNLWFD
jgi:hypothetical protein